MRCKLGIERQEIPNRGRGFGAPAEVPAGRGHNQKGPEQSWHVDSVRAFEGLLVLALMEMVPEASEMHPTGVVGVELHGSVDDGSAALELASVHDLQSQDPERVSVERI